LQAGASHISSLGNSFPRNALELAAMAMAILFFLSAEIF